MTRMTVQPGTVRACMYASLVDEKNLRLRKLKSHKNETGGMFITTLNKSSKARKALLFTFTCLLPLVAGQPKW